MNTQSKLHRVTLTAPHDGMNPKESLSVDALGDASGDGERDPDALPVEKAWVGKACSAHQPKWW